MAGCLSVYITNQMIKYAKINYNPNNRVMSLEQYGTKFLKEDRFDAIKNLVVETRSEDLPVVLSTYDDNYQKIQMFNQLAKQDRNNVIKLEFNDWCEKKSQDPNGYLNTYFLPELTIGDYYVGLLNIVKRQQIDLYNTTKSINVGAIFPAPFTIRDAVPRIETDYLVVDLSDRLFLTAVIEDKIAEIVCDDMGMNAILEKLSNYLGSYQKAYEACKQINVFTDGENTNVKEIEDIVEPILQQILKNISEVVIRHKSKIKKLYITGMGTLFTNVDILFREYFDIKTEILKPNCITQISDVRNLAEMLEVTPAIAMAYAYIEPKTNNSTIEYFNKVQDKGIIAWFNKKADDFKKSQNAKKFEKYNSEEYSTKQSQNSVGIEPGVSETNGFTSFSNNNKIDEMINDSFTPSFGKQNKIKIPEMVLSGAEKATKGFVIASIVVAMIIIVYLVFGNVYYSQITKIKKNIETETQSLVAKTQEVNNDYTYIKSNTDKYKTINDGIESTVKKIESNEIGKFTTYNVASFMQKIIKIIPTGIQLKTISSDDNKNVKIVAQSNSYADLGYFVAQLREQTILNNVEINNIQNGTTIVVEIGGDLP